MRDDWENFNNGTHCYVCEKLFAPGDTQIHDYCHLTGWYSDPAHSNCDINYKDLRCISVVFYHLYGYDAHFVKEIATAYEGRVDLFPVTKEKYISFIKYVDGIKNNQKNCVKLRLISIYIDFSFQVWTNCHLFLVKINYRYCNANFPIYSKKILIFWHERAFFRTSTLTASKSWRSYIYHFVLQFIERRHDIWKWLHARR